jgi:hypothetical protein
MAMTNRSSIKVKPRRERMTGPPFLVLEQLSRRNSAAEATKIPNPRWFSDSATWIPVRGTNRTRTGKDEASERITSILVLPIPVGTTRFIKAHSTSTHRAANCASGRTLCAFDCTGKPTE